MFIVTYMNSTATTAGFLHSTEANIAGYRLMLTVAKKYGMEYEQDRITFQIEEFEAKAESLRDRLIELGYDMANV